MSAADQYVTRVTTRSYVRKTYIAGTLIGKFYGDADRVKDQEQYARERYFNITLYEAIITDAISRRHSEGRPDEAAQAEEFPGTLPDPLPCTIQTEGGGQTYFVELRGVRLYNIDFNKHRALQQVEDDEVFGTVEARICGYLLEAFEEKTEEQILIEKEVPSRPFPITTSGLTKTGESTGKEERTGNYLKKEYYWSDYIHTYWESTYDPLTPKDPGGIDTEGCLSSIGGLLVLLISVGFLAAIGPTGIGVLLAIAAVVACIWLFARFFLWIIRLAVLALIVFALLPTSERSTTGRPTVAKDEPSEVSHTTVPPPVREGATTLPPDSIITHYRRWKDYAGNMYAGNITVRLADYRKSHAQKQQYTLAGHTEEEAYNILIAYLQAADSQSLGGVYPLFDSIRAAIRPNAGQFANILVSFVQDIPYAIVVDGPCEASAYEDAFTKEFLRNSAGACDDYEQFGINSPVEFMAKLKGDCDTRTLLLYTLLRHYGYGVAVLSSTYYAHSLLAVEVALPGRRIGIQGRQYVVWETTATSTPAGIIPPAIADFSRWNVSLLYQP